MAISQNNSRTFQRLLFLTCLPTIPNPTGPNPQRDDSLLWGQLGARLPTHRRLVGKGRPRFKPRGAWGKSAT